jgi:NAD(P)-dependent dehydrogenase (short-subunit alcohol dehydrogenase family)
MRSLPLALGSDGIAVSSVAPGLTDTPGSRTVNSNADFDAVVEHQALKRRLTARTRRRRSRIWPPTAAPR